MSTPSAWKGFKAFLRYALVAVVVVVAAPQLCSPSCEATSN
jgi:hypothetical protein